MQEEARKKLKDLEPKLDAAMKRVEELKAKRAEAREAGNREEVKRLNDRANEVFENDYIPLLHRVERQKEIIDDPPVWKPMPDT